MMTLEIVEHAQNLESRSHFRNNVKERLFEYQAVFDLLPKNTRKAYLADMGKFFAWCELDQGSLQDNLEENKHLLKAYFTHLLTSDLARASIVRSKASLSKLIKITLLPNPFHDDIFSDWLRLSLKVKPARQKQAIALTDKLLSQINAQLNEDDVMQLRDKVLLNVMFDGVLRAGELSKLQCHDISFRNKTLFLAESKTDQEGQGDFRALSTYSLTLIKKWQDKASIIDGYLLRQLTGLRRVTSKALGYDGVSNAFKRFSLLVDIDNAVFSGHSARVGAAVTMAEHDCSTLDIQRSGGWKSAAMPARYTEQVSIHKQGMGSVMNKISR